MRFCNNILQENDTKQLKGNSQVPVNESIVLAVHLQKKTFLFYLVKSIIINNLEWKTNGHLGCKTADTITDNNLFKNKYKIIRISS